MKKYVPIYLRVINCANDVIVTSDPISTYGFEAGEGLIQGRCEMRDDEF